MRPSLMTTISSATSRASSWSWVTNTVVTWTSSCRRRSQSRSSLRTLASRAPNGSSSSSTVGSTASARARAMRWRWPPESCDGSRSANCSRCTSSSSSSTRRRDLVLGPLADLEPEGHVAAHRQVLERGVVLEHEADVALLRRQVGGVDALDLDACRRRRCSRPAMMRSSVDLPPPLGPSSAVSCPVGMVDRHVVEGDEVAEALADVRTSMLTISGLVLLGRMNGHDDDAGHRHQREQEGGGVGAALVEVEVLLLDDERGGAGLAEDVARHDLARRRTRRASGRG